MDFSGMLLNNQYRILQCIGEGGMSCVYKAEDTKNNAFVAVKFMKAGVTSSYIEDSIRFRKELEIAGRFDHPGIARVFGSGEYEGTLFYVMEYLDGETFDQYICESPVLNWDEIADIFFKLAEILNYIHSSGIVHKDVKPGNFFITRTGNRICFKLLDFGVAHIMELGEIRTEAGIAGTFGYMSPEVAGLLNVNIDERCDLYSLGVIFYQLLTGGLPFKAMDVGRMLYQQAAALPAHPLEINREIPADLAEITMKLLVKDPDSRYQSARGLLYDINRYIKGDRNFYICEGDRKVKLTFRSKLVGRKHEMEKITGLIQKAQEGKGSICFISGEAGAGKSRLVEEFRNYAYRHDILFLGARCLNHENKMPYQPFKDIIDGYIGNLEKSGAVIDIESESLREIVGDFGEILIQLNPRIKRFIGETKELTKLEPERENQRFLKVLSDFFCSFCERTNGCILFLDDLQWVDAGSISLLEEIARKIDRSKLFVIGTYRDNEVGERHGIKNIINESKEHKYPVEEVGLERLDSDAVNELAACILGEKIEGIENITGYLFEKSDGNPLYAVCILRELIESNMVTRNDEGRYNVADGLIGLQLPESMLNAIIKRIGRLDEPYRELLCKAAIIGREFEIELLHYLVDCNYEELVGVIDNAVSMQLLDKSPNKRKLLFAHDRIRDVFCFMLEDETRQKIHHDIAAAVEELNRDNIEKVVYELAYHYIEAKDVQKALEYAILAGDKAKQSYANEDAVKFYLAALDFLKKQGLKNNPEWIRVNECLIEVFLLIGRNDDAIRMSEELLPMLETPISKSRIYKKIGIAYFKKGDWEKCERNIGMGLRLLGEKIPVKRAESFVSLFGQLIAHLLLGLIPEKILRRSISSHDLEEKKEIIWFYYTLSWAYGLSDNFKLLRCAFRSLNLSVLKIGLSKELGSSLSLYAGLCMTVSLFERGLKYHQKALNVRCELGDKWGEAQTFQFMGYNLNWKGEYAQSAKCFEKSIRMFRDTGDLWEEGQSLVGLTGILIYTSAYKDGINNCQQYLEQSKKMNNIYGVNVAKQSWARLLIEMGDFNDAEELLKSTAASSHENNIMILYCVAQCYLGYLYLEKNQFTQAVESLVQAKECYLENNFLKDPLLQIFPHLAEAYVKKLLEQYKNTGIKPPAKEIRKAQLLCRDALKKTKRWISHYETAIRAAAGFYVLIGKTAKAERLFKKSMDYSKKLGRKYEAAKGHLEYGMVLRTAGMQREALENFQKAYELFVEIGAKAYIKKCEAVLSKDAAGETHSDGLTARDRLRSERQMNMVLATGRYISSILDQDELLKKIMDGVVELVGAERGVLLLYHEGEGKLQAKVLHNVNSGKEWEDGHSVSRSIISKVEEERAPLLISDALSEEHFRNRSSVILNAVKSVICVPIMVKGELLGIIYLDNNLINGLFSEEDLDIVSNLAGQAGVSIQNARMYAELKEYLDQIQKSKNEITELNRKLELRVEERTEELNKRNLELASAISKLKEQAVMVEELAVTKERNRFAMDAHDHLGHTLTLLIKLLEVSRMTCLDAPGKLDQKLGEAERIAREGLEELRTSVKGLISSKIQKDSLQKLLEGLVEDFRALGIHVDFSISNLQEIEDAAYIEALHTVCLEASTNAVRHGKAKNISIIIKKEDMHIRMVIFDDGIGCKEINKGLGLLGMKKRINAVNGNIDFNSDGENGFIIHVEIPYEQERRK